MNLVNVRKQIKANFDMAKAKAKGLRSILRSTPLLLLLGLSGVTTAVTLGMPGLTLPTATGGSISDSPKEVIDQVWQIVYRDYLDSSGDYNEDTWRRLRRDLLKKSLRWKC